MKLRCKLFRRHRWNSKGECVRFGCNAMRNPVMGAWGFRGRWERFTGGAGVKQLGNFEDYLREYGQQEIRIVS